MKTKTEQVEQLNSLKDQASLLCSKIQSVMSEEQDRRDTLETGSEEYWLSIARQDKLTDAWDHVCRVQRLVNSAKYFI